MEGKLVGQKRKWNELSGAQVKLDLTQSEDWAMHEGMIEKKLKWTGGFLIQKFNVSTFKYLLDYPDS
ncbi:MAG: hypothetical protein M1148_01030 [Candidatus Thermoplasmatota archaeon]|nr:hypothetical protein [Candidatus Thermoplasmatota archaeon]